MIKTIISDLSYTIIFPKDLQYKGELNALYTDLKSKMGDINFWDYFTLNQEMIDYFKTLKEQVSLNIFTSGTIQNNLQLGQSLANVFTRIFSAYETDLSKSDPVSYTKICSFIGSEPATTLYVDDQSDFCKAAKESGLHVINYLDNESFFAQAKKLIDIDIIP